MTVKSHVLKVFLDRRGNLEIEGLLQGTSEADRIAEAVEYEPFHPLDFLCSSIRAEGLDEAARDRVRAWAAREGHELEESEDLGPMQELDPEGRKPHRTTIDAVHEHSLEPSLREKVLVPVILLGVALVLVFVGLVVFDHVNAKYTRVATMKDVVLYAAQDHPVPTGLAAFFDPDDAGYVKTDVRSWSHWFGKAAVTGDAFVLAPDLPITIEELVKGKEGTSARVTFLFDLRQSQPPRYHVTGVERGGMATDHTGFDLEIYPLRTADMPASDAYAGDGRIEFDQEATFADLDRVASNGYVEVTGDGLQLRARRYRVALSGLENESLRRLLETAALTAEESSNYEAAMQPRPRIMLPGSKRVTVYGTLVERYPWGTAADPGPRRDGVIGRLRVDGVAFGTLYVPAS